MNSIGDLGRGLLRSPAKVAGYAFSSFSMIFTVIKALNHFAPQIQIEGAFPLLSTLLISIGFALKKVWKPSKVEICVATCASKIEVVFGDIFEQDGIRAIAVNEFFDSKLGKPVSDRSLHGMLIQKCFGGHAEPFDKQVSAELAQEPFEVVHEKFEGKNQQYKIGTTAVLVANSDRYIVFALAHTDPQTCKASADVTMMWNALNMLWARARIECGGHPLNLPLVGSGLSGLGLPTRDLLNLLILSAITVTKASEITTKIRIVLHRDRFDDLDLREVKKHWEEK
ncbi:macro domain-containing protein [Massilia sp. Root418]|uniref:macro domain-containing protein n=1 Tax=Massilia sp. Root418 TaxID=1736532 RepID=UPI000A7852BB|nr:macro domain-containing protein [Massilia sp. Root418]